MSRKISDFFFKKSPNDNSDSKKTTKMDKIIQKSSENDATQIDVDLNRDLEEEQELQVLEFESKQKPSKTEEKIKKDPKTGKFQCTICKKLLSTKSTLLTHLEYHKKPKINCKKCGKILKNEKFQSIHICASDCEFCGQKFANSKYLKVHLRRYHENDLKFSLFKCNLCRFKFSSEVNLKKHKIVKHLNVKKVEFCCDFDGKKFKNRELLKGHMKTHCMEKCTICDKDIQATLINVHRQRIHGILGDFKCRICDKKLISKKNFNCTFKSS